MDENYVNVITPRIVKEVNQGYTAYEICDDMFMNREIQCVGEINDCMSQSIIFQMLHLQKEDPEKEITMYINSHGGSVDAGLAIYDVMKKLTCPVRTVCIGLAASMAAVLFTSGNTREILEHSKVMIHDPLINNFGGNALRIKSISDDLMETREIIANIISSHTGKSLEEIYEKTAKDTYFRGKEAVEFGLADKIAEQL